MRGNGLLGGGLRSPPALLVVIHVSLVCALILVLCFSSPAELLLFWVFWGFFSKGNILDSMLLKASNKEASGSRKETSGSTVAAPSAQRLLWCHCYHYCPEDSTNNTCRWAEIWTANKQTNIQRCISSWSCGRAWWWTLSSRTDGYCFTMVEEEAAGVPVQTAGCLGLGGSVFQCRVRKR